jgi:hypothetical protein
MGVDLGGAFTIAGVAGAQALKFAGASEAFRIDTTGRTTYPNQIGFIAGYNIDPGWLAQPAGWLAINHFNNTTYNKGSGYSASRFTAPVAGSYLLHFTAYHYKPSAVAGHYIHPMFWVNGGAIQSAYRLKAYETPAGYSFVAEIVDIYYLNAGDFVDVMIFYSNTGMSMYRYYSMFSGMLVG